MSQYLPIISPKKEIVSCAFSILMICSRTKLVEKECGREEHIEDVASGMERTSIAREHHSTQLTSGRSGAPHIQRFDRSEAVRTFLGFGCADDSTKRASGKSSPSGFRLLPRP